MGADGGRLVEPVATTARAGTSMARDPTSMLGIRSLLSIPLLTTELQLFVGVAGCVFGMELRDIGSTYDDGSRDTDSTDLWWE